MTNDHFWCEWLTLSSSHWYIHNNMSTSFKILVYYAYLANWSQHWTVLSFFPYVHQSSYKLNFSVDWPFSQLKSVCVDGFEGLASLWKWKLRYSYVQFSCALYWNWDLLSDISYINVQAYRTSSGNTLTNIGDNTLGCEAFLHIRQLHLPSNLQLDPPREPHLARLTQLYQPAHFLLATLQSMTGVLLQICLE